MAPVVRLVPFGPPALAALDQALSAARRGPLDPVTVVVPSALVGVTVRRALAQPGHAGLRFRSFSQLRRELAALAGSTGAGTSPVLREARVRAAVSSAAEWPEPARTAAGTAQLAAVVQELEQARVDVEGLTLLEQAGGRAPAVAALHRAARLPEDPAPLAGAARTTVPVVLHLPRRLPADDLALCRALADRGLLQVVLGLTGEVLVDAPVRALADALAEEQVVAPPSVPATPRVRCAPDPEEEVRVAVRDVLARLGTGTRPDRIGLAYRSRSPYARLLHEQLHATGIPHHVPRQRSLAQSLSGAALLGLLALADEDWGRADVLAWLGSAPLRSADGAGPRLTTWDRLARSAGVTRSLAVWRSRLDAHAAVLGAPADDEPASVTRSRQELPRLRAAVEQLVEDDAALRGATSWVALADTSADVLRRWLGEPDRWSDAEARAHAEVLAALGRLAELDDLPQPPPLEDVAEALRTQLGAPVRESSGLGKGVLVAPVAELAGADLDLLLVLGVAEGSYPPRLREHPLLRDEVRVQIGLRTTSDRRLDERRDHLALLRAAPEVVLSAPRSDSRAQRPVQPSPWLLEHGEPEAPHSFEAALRGTNAPASAQEHLVQLLLTKDVVLTSLDPVLARGHEAVRARAGGVFGPWLGGLSVAVPETVLEHGRSASALQTYAVCPFRWFASSALRVRDREEPVEDDVSPLERGTLVHAVLEQLVGQHLGRSPDAAWTQEEHASVVASLEQHAGQLLAEGKAGRPVTWQVRVAQMRRVLRRLLLADDAYRKARRATPRAVELTFGLPDADRPAAVLDLPSGRTVSLRGSADRVDVTDSGVVVVLDYKTGRSKDYGDFPEEGKPADDVDLTGRGQRLQLPLYAVAAAREHPRASKVEAWYSFVDEGGTRRGGVVGPAERERLLEVLDITTGGMEGGVFPARPGAYDAFYRQFSNCGFCAYDRTCSSGRDDQWAAVASDPRVQPYAELAEGQP